MIYTEEEDKNKDLCDKTQDVEDRVCKKDNVEYMLKVIDKVTDGYSEKQKNIYMSWIGKQISDSKETMRSIAKKNNCTTQNVSLVIKRTNKKVQDYFNRHGLTT